MAQVQRTLTLAEIQEAIAYWLTHKKGYKSVDQSSVKIHEDPGTPGDSTDTGFITAEAMVEVEEKP